MKKLLRRIIVHRRSEKNKIILEDFFITFFKPMEEEDFNKSLNFIDFYKPIKTE